MKGIDKNDVWVTFVFSVVFFVIIYWIFRGNKLTNEFYKMKINSIVIKSSDWQKSSIRFYLDNGVGLSFLAPAEGKMDIGDSVSKPKNTFIYDVYRKNEDSVMMHFATYNYTIQQ